MTLISESNIKKYLTTIKDDFEQGNATEHTHRPTLKTMLESYDSKVKATNEPKRIKCGAPDFFVSMSLVPIGHIEAKDVGEDLDKIEKTEQLQRYFSSLSNLVLTNYTEFRWYINGNERLRTTVAHIDNAGNLKFESNNFPKCVSILNQFLEFKHEIISSPKDLAIRMAKHAKIIRDSSRMFYDIEPSDGQFHTHYKIFQETLIPDLTVDSFCDMLAQTISYGLFAAKCASFKSELLTREKAGFLVPKTNPFLRKFFYELAGPDLDESISWAVDDLIEILNSTNMDKIISQFLKRRENDDAVIHFYETFLSEYNPEERFARGVFYTPPPVVSFIVRSVDRILRNQFNCAEGVADASKIKIKNGEKEESFHKVLILDPACGTGTFLSVIINMIEDYFKNNKGMFSSYVQDHILPRIFGFELLMAPYAISHIKLGLRLASVGYNFSSDERLQVYLTNTLEDPQRKNEVLFSNWVSKEGDSASKIKRNYPVMVIIGNPPYKAVSANMGKWITKLIDDYRYIGNKRINERKYSIQDDYIKFIRFAQWKIEKTGSGIIAFITNNNFLDATTLRAMRYNLLKTFDEIRILNLHGSAKRDDAQQFVKKDQNVFDIKQGVAISFLIKNNSKEQKTDNAKVFYNQIFGTREKKYAYLQENYISSIKWKKVKPELEFYSFIPKKGLVNKKYPSWIKITDIFEKSSTAIETARDSLAFGFSKEELVNKINQLIDPDFSDEELKNLLKIKDTPHWTVSEARNNIRKDKNWIDYICDCSYRPFDNRPIFNSKDILHRPRTEIMRNFENKENIALLCTRQLSAAEFHHVFCTNIISERCVLSTKTKEGTYCCPLYVYSQQGRKILNLKTEFIKKLSNSLNLILVDSNKGDLKKTFGPYDIFAYIYAILHSQTYRTNNFEMLRFDFPRIPVPPSLKFFKQIKDLGDQLIKLHLNFESLKTTKGQFPKSGSNKIETIKVIQNSKQKSSVNIIINYKNDKPNQFFSDIPKNILEFKIGSYRVLEKWLKERKNRKLSFQELSTFQKIITSISKTIEIMDKIEKNYTSNFKN